jgi:superoxide reductase
MTQLHQVYKCPVCGNIVEVLHTGEGELVCCGQPMELMTAKNNDEGQEKHVPVIGKTDQGIKITVGSVEHPMEDQHYIEWIELIADGYSYKQFLTPQDKPQTEFNIRAEQITARAYCNLHGLWQN